MKPSLADKMDFVGGQNRKLLHECTRHDAEIFRLYYLL